MQGLGYLAIGLAMGMMAGALIAALLGIQYVKRVTLDARARVTAAKLSYRQQLEELTRRGGYLVVKFEHYPDRTGPAYLENFPIAREKVLLALRLAAQGRPFSENKMERFIGTTDFSKLQHFLLKHGWLRWRDPSWPRGGTEWTHAGQAALNAVLNESYENSPEIQEYIYSRT